MKYTQQDLQIREIELNDYKSQMELEWSRQIKPDVKQEQEEDKSV